MRRFFSKPKTRAARSFSPCVEALESRWCPSAVGIVQTGHTLAIHGDGANDTVLVRDNGQGGVTASITLAGHTQTVSATGITKITIDAGGGNDAINYQLTGALAQQETLNLCLDKGSSQATLDYSAGLANALLAVNIEGGPGGNQVTTQFGRISGSRLNLMECLDQGAATSHVNFDGPISASLATVVVGGGSGSDKVFARLGDMTSSNLQFLGHLGKGADSFDLEAAGSLRNAVAHFDIDGGPGGNAITFNANGVNVDATSRLNLETCSGAGNDSVTLNYSGQMNGELDVHLQAGAGDDAVNTTLTLAQGSTGRVRAEADGGKGDDAMSFTVNDKSNPGGKSTLALLEAVLNGGAGHNKLTATPNVEVVK